MEEPIPQPNTEDNSSPFDRNDLGALKVAVKEMLPEFNRIQAVTLKSGDVTFEVRNSDTMSISAAAAVSISTITNGYNGQRLTLIFNDAFVTLVNDASGAKGTLNLGANILSANYATIDLICNGTSWLIDTVKVTYAQLDTATLGTAAATFSTNTFAAKKHLRFIIYIPALSVTDQLRFRFNGDSGNNYNTCVSENWVETLNTAQSAGKCDINNKTATSYITGEIYNVAAVSKRVNGNNVVANGIFGTKPFQCVWTNTTNQITSMTLSLNGGNNLPVGTEITIFGMD